MSRISVCLVMAVVAVAVSLVAPVLAADIFSELTAGSVLGFDPSTRSIGMGGASTAVFWANPNPWANPALIATTQGLRFEHGEAVGRPGGQRGRARLGRAGACRRDGVEGR